MKFDIKGLFILDAILGMITGIVLQKLIASVTSGATATIPGLPQVLPAIGFGVAKSETIYTLIVCALPAIMSAGRIGTIFKWAFYTQLTFLALNVIDSLAPPAGAA